MLCSPFLSLLFRLSRPEETVAAPAGGDNNLNIAETEIESNWETVIDNFDNMELKAELLRGVYAYGFERPSAIQQRAIMPVINGECPRLCAPVT